MVVGGFCLFHYDVIKFSAYKCFLALAKLKPTGGFFALQQQQYVELTWKMAAEGSAINN
jgi:hypothetical protein